MSDIDLVFYACSLLVIASNLVYLFVGIRKVSEGHSRFLVVLPLFYIVFWLIWISRWTSK